MTRSSGFLTCPDQNGASLFQTGLGLVLSKINLFDPPRIVLFPSNTLTIHLNYSVECVNMELGRFESKCTTKRGRYRFSNEKLALIGSGLCSAKPAPNSTYCNPNEYEGTSQGSIAPIKFNTRKPK